MSMTTFKSLKWLSRKRSGFPEGVVHGAHGFRMRQLSFMGVVCIFMLFIVYRTTNYQYRRTEIDGELHPFDSTEEPRPTLNSLPKGIIQPRSDLEFKSLGRSSPKDDSIHRNLLAMAVGIKQKDNVDAIVQKFLSNNFTILLFHYDGSMEGWWDLDWSNEAIHITAQNQTKWWFAKRFLHPDIVSIYDYIFLWDEDLGVENFHPGRYLEIARSAGLEISQPALDPNSTEIHHRITIRKKTKRLHRRIYEGRGSLKCSSTSRGPPCTGWVEGMAPVFSRAAWRCTWHLIQNDLVHGWGLDMKIGYCAQGDRTKKVGIIDSEYIVHQGIPSLGGGTKKDSDSDEPTKKSSGMDSRVLIRRQATSELQTFKERWDKAVKEDSYWVDPYKNWRDPFAKILGKSNKMSKKIKMRKMIKYHK